jgi:hypothetical protein
MRVRIVRGPESTDVLNPAAVEHAITREVEAVGARTGARIDPSQLAAAKRSGECARPRMARGPIGGRRVVPGKGEGEVGPHFGRVRGVPTGYHDRAAPGITPHRRGRCWCLRQASPLRARRAGAGQIAARAYRCGSGWPRGRISEHFQVRERLSGRSAQIRRDAMTAACPSRRGRNATDHQEHAECPGDPVLRSPLERRDHVDSSW